MVIGYTGAFAFLKKRRWNFVNFFRRRGQDHILAQPGFQVVLVLTLTEQKFQFFSKNIRHLYAQSPRERTACCVNMCLRKGVSFHSNRETPSREVEQKNKVLPEKFILHCLKSIKNIHLVYVSPVCSAGLLLDFPTSLPHQTKPFLVHHAEDYQVPSTCVPEKRCLKSD